MRSIQQQDLPCAPRPVWRSAAFAAAVTLAALLVVMCAPRAESQGLGTVRPNSASAFALEALGASVGSLIGMGIVALATKCGVDDLGCVIATVTAGGAAGAAGAAVGTMLVARHTGSSRSAGGAVAGAIVGTGIGLGIHYLLNRESDRNLGDMITIPIFVLAQGTFAALGSRFAGRKRS
jgi:hypothetical protein